MPIFHAVGVFVGMFVFAQCIAVTRGMSCGLPFFHICAQAGALIGVVKWLVISSAGLAVSDCMHVGSTLSFFRTLQPLGVYGYLQAHGLRREPVREASWVYGYLQVHCLRRELARENLLGLRELAVVWL